MTDDSPDWMASHAVTIALADAPQTHSADGFATTALWLGRPNPEQPYSFGEHPVAPILRRAFTAAAPIRSAVLRVAGFGYVHAEINGEPVSDAVIDPPPSQFNRTVFSRAHDVTRLLRQGVNAIAMLLGRGYASGISGPGAPWTSEPRAMAHLEIEYADGTQQTIVTDETWKTADSGLRDWMYFGEEHDARRHPRGWSNADFDDAEWESAKGQEWPTERVIEAVTPPVRVVDTFSPVMASTPAAGVHVYDFGKITAGWARIAVRGDAGALLTISYGQQLDSHGRVALFAPNLNVDQYTLLGGDLEQWEPRFTRHSFQFVEIAVQDGAHVEITKIEARECHTHVPSTGSFECSSDLLNRIHENHRRSLAMNHWGFPTDTAGRDRQGWTADTALFLDSAIFNFAGLRDLYHDWLLSLRDTQQADGTVSIFAPDSYEFPIFNDPSWSGMIVMIPWMLYQHFGDERILTDNYDAMVSWMDLMAEQISQTADLYAGFSFGDHSPPGVEIGGSVNLSPPEGSDVTRNAHLYLEARTLAEISRIVGDPFTGTTYDDLADRIRTAFNATYLQSAGDEYRTPTQEGYRQTSNVAPLAFGLVPAENEKPVLDRLVADLEGRGARLNTGAIGTKQLLPLLTRHGRGDLAYRIAAQTEYPSWGYWVSQGATASWETWRNEGPEQTKDHPFLGTVDDWFYRHLAGIQPAEPGYARLLIAPLFTHDLDHVAASIDTSAGPVSVRWERQPDGVRLTVHSVQPADIRVPGPANAVTVIGGRVETILDRADHTVLTSGGGSVEIRISAA